MRPLDDVARLLLRVGELNDELTAAKLERDSAIRDAQDHYEQLKDLRDSIADDEAMDRKMFAAMAMQGLIANGGVNAPVVAAVRYADELLKELVK